MTLAFWCRLAAVLWCVAGVSAVAQTLPERRVVAVEDTDFYGGDLRSIFDTTQEICVAACLESGACRAFTYNIRSAACFLKSDVTRSEPYVGALSGRIVAVAEGAEAQARARAAALGFVDPSDLGAARDMARDLGLRFPPNDRSVAALRAAGAGAEPGVAAAWAARAAAVGDGAAEWRALAEAILAIPLEGADAGYLSEQARGAALNAYLRAADAGGQAAALDLLAVAYERRGEGRLAVPTLRLAESLAPGRARADALARVRSLFGFAVADSRVESEPAEPRVCLEFSEDLAPRLDYAPYVRVEGVEALAVEARGRSLCLTGVAHGARYRVVARAGLPSAAGDTLAQSAEVEVYVRDRAPLVRFTGRAYVLPKGPGASIPVVSVNLAEVDLKIHRVGSRNLMRAIQGDLFDQPVAGETETRLAQEIGAAVWEGTGTLAPGPLNAEVTTALPVTEAIAALEPGVYVMTARAPGVEADYWERAATQWFVITDLGLATLSGADGVHVVVRSLATAAPAAGVRLALIAANNEVLGEAVTGPDGRGHFAPGLAAGTGGAAPALLTAEGAGDFAFLDLSRPGFDFGDRGVGGRAPAGPVDLFVATERGVYRPGEAVHLTVLARDAGARAIEGLPLTAVVTRPDGVEFRRALLPPGQAGGTAWSFRTDAGAQRGTWAVRVHVDPEAPALARQTFLVEDFLPERLDVVLELAEGAVDPLAPPRLGIAARYLYGAPAGGLGIEGEVRRETVGSREGWPGYRFGLEGSGGASVAEPLAAAQTDAAGLASVALAVPGAEAASLPEQVTIAVRVRDASGRPVERVVTRAMVPPGPMIGVKPLFEGTVEEGELARFDLAGVAPDGAAVALEAAWTLERIEADYQWYEIDGAWNYEVIERRARVAGGTWTGGVVEVPVTWGRYEFAAVAGAAATSLRFDAGWYGAGVGTDTPDRLAVGLDKPAYAPGETARLRLDARDAGAVSVAVVGDGLIEMRLIEVAVGETVVELPVTEAWGTGAYVTATLIRPMDRAAGRNPTRAVGVAWAGVDPGARKLTLRFTGPAEQAPRGALDAGVEIVGAPPGEAVFVTVAAVDAGILNLTGYTPPAPVAWYFGQRRLGVEFRDLYGRLIDGMQGAAGALRSGGDGAGIRPGAEPPTQRLVAFHSGVVQVGPDGRAAVRFDLPDFNGTVRLMAVAWSGAGVGEASTDVLVRDPVVAQVTGPRFLAPGDSARVLLELTHLTGPVGAVAVGTSAGPGLEIAPGAPVVLAQGARVAVELAVTARAVGAGGVSLDLVLPGGARVTKRLDLPVRALDPVVERAERVVLAPGAGLDLGADRFAGFVPGSGRMTLGLGALARIDVPGLMAALDRYPYGCTEQITSRALPLLSFDAVARALGLVPPEGVAARIEAAIAGVLANQSAAGGFGLWAPGEGDLWLDAYVADFLGAARAAGHMVPPAAFDALIARLRAEVGYARDFEQGGEGLAYALMVLAREGAAPVADLRYYADARGQALGSALAQAQIGAALALVGEPARADAMFRLANARALAGDDPGGWRADYGSAARDAAGVLALGVGAGSQAVDRDGLVAALTGAVLSPQDQAWALRAAAALGAEAAASASLDGAPVTGPLVRLFEEGALGRPVRLANTGAAPLDAVVSVTGVPVGGVRAEGTGYGITRAYYALDGSPLDIATVAPNTRAVVVLSIREAAPTQGRLVIEDPLPAGFEIDNPSLVRAGDVAGLAWLSPVEDPAHREFRADRFIAAVDRDGSEGGGFTLAYIVRAVTPGRFHHPAASVADMYRPRMRAVGDSGTVEVTAP